MPKDRRLRYFLEHQLISTNKKEYLAVTARYSLAFLIMFALR